MKTNKALLIESACAFGALVACAALMVALVALAIAPNC